MSTEKTTSTDVSKEQTSSGGMSTMQLAHIAGEIIIIGGISLFFQKQNIVLKSQVRHLESRVETLEATMAEMAESWQQLAAQKATPVIETPKTPPGQHQIVLTNGHTVIGQHYRRPDAEQFYHQQPSPQQPQPSVQHQPWRQESSLPVQVLNATNHPEAAPAQVPHLLQKYANRNSHEEAPNQRRPMYDPSASRIGGGMPSRGPGFNFNPMELLGTALPLIMGLANGGNNNNNNAPAAATVTEEPALNTNELDKHLADELSKLEKSKK